MHEIGSKVVPTKGMATFGDFLWKCTFFFAFRHKHNLCDLCILNVVVHKYWSQTTVTVRI